MATINAQQVRVLNWLLWSEGYYTKGDAGLTRWYEAGIDFALNHWLGIQWPLGALDRPWPQQRKEG